MAATVPEVKTRLASDLTPVIPNLAVDSDETGGWEKLLTAHNSRDQGISLGFGNEEEAEILEEKRDTTDVRHIMRTNTFCRWNFLRVEGDREKLLHHMNRLFQITVTPSLFQEMRIKI